MLQNRLFKNFSDNYFSGWIQKQCAASHFLVVLSHSIENIIKKIELTRSALPIISSLISEMTCRDFFYQHIQIDWSEKIMRAGVVELHAHRQLGKLKATTSEGRFQEFIYFLSQSENAIDFLNKYVVLQHQWNCYQKQVISAFSDLFYHLETEWDEIKKLYFFYSKKIILKDIRRQGDVHAGKFVAILVFSVDGEERKIVYKPRSLAMDFAYYHALDWLNKKISLAFFIPKIINREDYGFYEFIIHRTCKTWEEVDHYYERLGGLTAVLHAFIGSDMHAENVIAAGDQPVVVDLECLLSPCFNQNKSSFFYRSILDIGILPKQWFVNDVFSGLDLSALGARANQPLMHPILRPMQAGLDTMTVERVTENLQIALFLPFFQGEKVQVANHFPSFKKGFFKIFDILSKESQVFIDRISPHLEKAVARIIFRSTYEYSKLLSESYHPVLLMSLEKYQSHFSWLWMNANPLQKKIATFEIDDLIIGNIPLFRHPINKKKIVDASDRDIRLSVSHSGIVHWVDHVKHHFQYSQRAIHLNLINQVFCAYALNQRYVNQSIPAPLNRTPCKKKGLKKECVTIADRLYWHSRKIIEKHRILSVFYSNQVTWSTVTKSKKHTWEVEWIQNSTLYHGLMGVVMLFMYAEHDFFIQDNKNRLLEKLLLQTWDTVIIQVKETPFNNVGWFNGWGGFLYGLHIFSKHYPNHNHAALETDTLMQFEKIVHQTSEMDITNGLAGGLMALLSLHSFLPRIKTLTKCIVEKLLSYYPSTQLLQSTFPSPLVGYSHGTSGIAVALWYYAKRYHDTRAEEWVRAALHYERSVFSEKYQNWPDFRDHSIEHHPHYAAVAWCHGAAGVVLSRLELYQAGYRDAFLHHEIKIGLQKMLRDGFSGVMNLCHGDLGNLDILLIAYQQGFISSAIYHEKLQYVLNELEKSDWETERGNSVFSVGLMTGQTGVAYQLLRCLKPNEVPSVLSIGKPIHLCY